LGDLIAIIGATGNFGRPVTYRLLDQVHRVRVITRSAEKARKHFGDRAEIIVADLTKQDEVVTALRGCDVVHVNMNLDRVSSEEAAAWPGFQHIAHAARVNNLSRISTIEGDPPLDAERGFICDPELHGGSKILAESGVPFTLFNPSWFMEGLKWFIEPDGRAIVPGMQRQKYHWIAASDYADIVARALFMPACANKRLWIHGPEALTIPEALSIWRARMLPGVKVEEVPVESMRTQFPDDIFWQRYMDLMDSMEHSPEIGDTTEANALLGAPKTTLREWIRQHSLR
jgi:uncharacterized protein YbjT (DUF2867 family)